MPSASATALAAGFTALLGASGEVLTFRGASVMGLVDRAGYAGRDRPPDFAARDMSRIEAAVEDIDPKPVVGESFTDADGFKHRIQTFKRLGHVWVMECATSKPRTPVTTNGDNVTNPQGEVLTIG